MLDRSSTPPTRARNATREELRRRLSSAPTDWLAEALENPELGPTELILLLRNGAASAELLKSIGENRAWTSHHELRGLLARHPHTPLVLARNLLPYLYWRDWNEISIDPRSNPVVRRQAEQLLLSHLDGRAMGERVALARRTGRTVIMRLLEGGELRVIDALLGNPRLVEADVVRLAAAASSSAEILRRLAQDAVWGCRRSVRLELLHRAELPVACALNLVRRMDRKDLQRLVEDDKVAPVVRIGAERLLRR